MATREGTRASIEFICISLVPDVCKSPIIPVGYKIFSKFDCAVAFSSNVRFRKQWAFRHNSRLSKVLCDEPGVGGGLLSGVNMGYCRPIDGTSSTTVRVNGSFVDYHEGTYMFMNCAGPEGPFNTIGRVCFLGNMLPGPVPKSGKVPKSCFSCISDLVTQLEDAVGPIDELVEKGKMLYSLAQTDWSDPSAVLGAIGGVAGIAGLQEVADFAKETKDLYDEAKDLYDTGKKIFNTDWSDPKQALAAVAGISNVLGMEDIAQAAGLADKIRNVIATDWSDPKAAIGAVKNIMSATGLDDMADEFIRDLLAPSPAGHSNADLPGCFPQPGKNNSTSSSTSPACDLSKIPASKDGKPRQCITQDVLDDMMLTNPVAYERYRMMSPEEQAKAFVETNKPSVDGNGTPVPANERTAVFLPGQGFSTTGEERTNSILPDTPSWLKEVFVAEKNGDHTNFVGIKQKKGNWYLFGGLVDLGSPEMPGAGAADTWFIPDNFLGLDMSGYYDYHDKNYYGSNVKLSDMDSILSHELKSMVAGIVENPLTLPLQAIYSTATTLVGTTTAIKNSVVGAFEDLSNLELPGREMFASLSDMYGKLFGESPAATPSDILNPTAGGGCFGGGAASGSGAGSAGGAPGSPAPPVAPAKPPGTGPSGSSASGAGSDGILVTTAQGNPAAAAAAIEANFRAANAEALADAQDLESRRKSADTAAKENATNPKADNGGDKGYESNNATDRGALQQERANNLEKLLNGDLSDEEKSQLNERNRQIESELNYGSDEKVDRDEIKVVYGESKNSPSEKLGTKAGAGIKLGKDGPAANANGAVTREQILQQSEGQAGPFTFGNSTTAKGEIGIDKQGEYVKGGLEEKASVKNPLGDELYCKGAGSGDNRGKTEAEVGCGIKGALSKDEKVGVYAGKSTDKDYGIKVEHGCQTDSVGQEVCTTKGVLNTPAGKVEVSLESKTK
jgi:hypothetical protein